MLNLDLIIDKLNTAQNLHKDYKTTNDKYAKYFIFILIMQNIIDASFLLIINLKLKKPKNYLEIFDILYSSSLIKEKTGLELRTFSALRNKLIYNYNNIEDNDYLIILKKFESCLLRFVKEIRDYLKDIS